MLVGLVHDRAPLRKAGMRIYAASSEETLRARKLLADWAGEGFLTQEQYQRLEQETVSELRTTNIFLRLVLFLFTLISVGAAVALFFSVFLPHSSDQTTGIFLLILRCVCYAAAEDCCFPRPSVSLWDRGSARRLLGWFSLRGNAVSLSSAAGLIRRLERMPSSLVPAAGAVFSLWIWRRFGLWYAFPAAMIFAVFLPGYWTSSHSAQHVIVALLYAIGLIGVIAVRSRHRFDYVEDDYSLAEAFLWLGIYLAINLQLSSLDVRAQLVGRRHRAASEFARSFYWTTWVLIWCPAARRARARDSAEGPLRHRGGRDCRHPDLRHQ